MKLPRWLVICLLSSSVLVMLAAAGWWWVTWPERTAHEFIGLIGQGRIEQANKMTAQDGFPPLWFMIPPQDRAADWSLSGLELDPRTFLDLLYGRQHFKLKPFRWGLTVERGRVVRPGSLEYIGMIDLEGDAVLYVYPLDEGW